MMRIIHRPIRGGKTYEIVTWATEKPNRYIFVNSYFEKLRILSLYGKNSGRKPPITKHQIKTYNSMLNGEFRELSGEIGIDNLEIFLSVMVSRLAGSSVDLKIATTSVVDYK